MEMRKITLVFFLFFFFNKIFSEEVYAFQGKHFIASYCGCSPEALQDVKQLEKMLLHAVSTCGATILGSKSHVFPPNGLTLVVLLSESHATIHTYPEHNSCFVDLFTCGNRCSNEIFDTIMRDYLKPQIVDAKLFLRHEKIEE
ncbi:MAG: adenosylmethionine decarboxylase [Chlamydiae bacterium]|nr:adenosylmethionine decarboxylase [Chlamydiota bacterium]